MGIDYFLIEEFSLNDFVVYKLFFFNNVVIIEGLDFLNVCGGKYRYVVLLLKLKDCDGVFVRVVLIEDWDS